MSSKQWFAWSLVFVLAVGCGKEEHLETKTESKPPAAAVKPVSPQCYLGIGMKEIYTSTYPQTVGSRNVWVESKEAAKRRYLNMYDYTVETYKDEFRKDEISYQAVVAFAGDADEADATDACSKKFSRYVSAGPSIEHTLFFKAAPLTTSTMSTYISPHVTEFKTTVVWGCYGACDQLKVH